MDFYTKLQRALECVRSKTDFVPKVAIVLGSGLGGFGEVIKKECIINYSEIEGFPVSTVQGHSGRYIFGYIDDVPVVAMQGRVHYYEGYDMTDVVLPVRLMGMLGARAVMLTNAAGGVDKTFTPGDFMMITSQITTFVPSPLRGKNEDRLGTRFPDMSGLYSEELQQAILSAAKSTGVDLKRGVYAQFPGPQFETTAEIKMASILGASAVGMSTACEAVAARHMGMKVCGVSCITNMAAGISQAEQSHIEVNETADRVAKTFEKFAAQCIREIAKAI